MNCCNPKLPEGNSLKTSLEFSCPECSSKGVPIERITIQNLLLDVFKSQISNKDDYKFCKNPICSVVYFSSGKSVFYKENLREKTTIKYEDLDTKTCYCFNVTKGDIVDELQRTGDCNVVSVIKAKMKDPGCFCEISNPQGSCCLANNIDFIKETKNKIQSRKDSPVKNKTGLFIGTGVIAGLLASLCCIGPLVLTILGVSGAAFLAKFDIVRTPLIFLVLGSFSFAGYSLYKKRQECESNSICADPKKYRKMIIAYWIGLVVAILGLISPYIIVWFF